jgi:hypothetical protein
MKRSRWLPNSRFAVTLLCLAALGWTAASKPPAPPVVEVSKLPVGTILPISLEHALSSKDLVKGEVLEGRIMQDVPLSGGQKIPAGSKILGSVVAVSYIEDGPSSITFRFVSLEPKRASPIPIVVGLRAMATYEAARSAQTPYQADTTGSPAAWAPTQQIGGDMRYGDGSKVTNGRKRVVGKATSGGGVLASPQDAPGSPCAGWPDASQGPQAVWVFSADACGLYDMKHVSILHAGNKDPLGDITIGKDEGEIKLMKSSALLLRVVK